MAKPNELYHHGVDGMKWGKRNGPPYPLDGDGKAALKEQKKEEKAARKAEKREERADQKALNSAAKHDMRYKNTKVMNKYRANQRVRRDIALGTVAGTAMGFLAGGPMVAIASGLGSAVGSAVTSGIVNTGIRHYENSKYKKMLINDQEFKNGVLKGKEIVERSKKNSNSNVTAMLTADEAKKLGLDESTRITGKEESDFWKAYAKQIEQEQKRKK